MKTSLALPAILLGFNIGSSAAHANHQSAAKVSEIDFLVNHRGEEQHKDRVTR